MDNERWQRLSPLLDALFELDPDARAEHLATLRREDPALADELQGLLELDEARQDFLAEPLLTPTPGARAGVEFGPYRLERLLGEGGMGQVWLAARSDGLYQRRVALKLLRAGLADAALRQRFTRERQILARLAHPHIARLLDAGIGSDGQPYLALDYVDGEPITDWCRARALPVDARLALFQQVCAAVSHAHSNLIVHRDLKPSNILVTPAGEVRLLDFGIAKLLDDGHGGATQDPQTRTGVRAFTLHYAAPEQLRGEPVTTMTDVYALGVVLYELLTDCKPYRPKNGTDAEWEQAILAGDPPRPSQAMLRGDCSGDQTLLARRARQVAGDLDNITLKALARLPQQRYASVEALALDVQRQRTGLPVLARRQSLRYRIGKYVQRHRWALGSGALVAVVLSAALGIVAWQARQALQEAARAQAMQDFVIGLFEHATDAPPEAALDVRALLDAGLERGDRELARQPLARAELLGVIARIRLGLGDYAEAEALSRHQSMVLRALPEAPAGLQLEAAAQHGRVLRLLGRGPDCIAAMRPLQDLAEGRSQLSRQTAEFHSQLGRCHRATGERVSARRLLERAITLRQRAPVDAVGIAENLIDLAALRSDVGESDAALAGFLAARAQLQSAAGPRHPLNIDLLRSIGTIQRERGDVTAAEKAWRAALALAEDVHGPRHPSTLTLRRSLGSALIDLGRYGDARRLLQPTHAALQARLGPRSNEVGSSWNALGIVAWELGDLDAAVQALQQTVLIWRQPAGAALLPGGLFNYGMVLHAAGRDAQALRVLTEARALRAQRFGEAHAQVGDTDRLLGEVHAALGQPAQARLHLQRGLRTLEQAEGAAHPRAAVAALAFARQQARDGDTGGALQRLQAIVGRPAPDPMRRRLRWRARAHLAALQCGVPATATQAAKQLQRLAKEVAVRYPDGGVVPREIAELRAGCLLPTEASVAER